MALAPRIPYWSGPVWNIKPHWTKRYLIKMGHLACCRWKHLVYWLLCSSSLSSYFFFLLHHHICIVRSYKYSYYQCLLELAACLRVHEILHEAPYNLINCGFGCLQELNSPVKSISLQKRKSVGHLDSAHNVSVTFKVKSSLVIFLGWRRTNILKSFWVELQQK